LKPKKKFFFGKKERKIFCFYWPQKGWGQNHPFGEGVVGFIKPLKGGM
jgi:hypothetical protein